MSPILASFPSPSQNVLEIGPLTIHFYGIMIAIGVIVAVLVAKRRYERFGGSGELVERVSIWAVALGFLGARLGYVITHTGDFIDRPWGVLFIWEGGLALYGGLTVGAITAIFLLRRSKGDIFAFGDAVAVGIPLAQAIGRWGNYFNQELFGTPSNLPWAVEIDPNIAAAAGYPGFTTFHPTFLYESLWNVFLTAGIILLLERRGKLAKGSSIALYLIIYGAGRFFMELMRTDTTYRLLGLSRNGWISAGAVLFGVGLLWWMQRRSEPRVLVGPSVFIAPGEQTVEKPIEPDEPSDGEKEDPSGLSFGDGVGGQSPPT
ncbi:MAG: prolipoprotein diacylglyceryl transferase [Actinomycetota bacterium]|nr:prolipoprotein diacylglyceryl transferase [Actinomycetota bacterium]